MDKDTVISRINTEKINSEERTDILSLKEDDFFYVY